MAQEYRFENRIAVVTGAAKGIGLATAEILAQEGAAVLLADLQAPDDAVAAWRNKGLNVAGTTADVADEAAIDRLFDEAERLFGRVDLLVNNAGTNLSYDLITEMPTELWERTLRINLTSQMFTLRRVLGSMVESGFGTVVNVASNVAKRGLPHRSAYVASKWAVLGLTQTAALEVAGTGVRVNAVLPGPTETALFNADLKHHAEVDRRQANDVRAEWLKEMPLGRVIQPVEVARVIAFLSCAESAAMTGQSINVTGGLIMH